MRHIVFSPTAHRDIGRIWDYIARGSVSAADRVADEIEAAAKSLGDMPGMGHTRPEVRDPRYRFWKVYSYLIVYRCTSRTLTILRVIHGAQDLRKLFRR